MAVEFTVFPAGYTTTTSERALTLGPLDGEDRMLDGYRVQNTSAYPCYVAPDTTASAGSILVPVGTMLVAEEPVNTLHVFTGVAGISVNGTTANGITIWGIS